MIDAQPNYRKQVINERNVSKIIHLDTAPQKSVSIPYDQKAEESVLGSIFQNPSVYYNLNGLIAEDFYILRNNWLFQAIEQLEAEGKLTRFDPVLLADKLKANRHFDDIGGLSYLTHLMMGEHLSFNAPLYADIVKTMAVRRRMMMASDHIKGLAMNTSITLEKAITEANIKLFDATEQGIREQDSEIKNLVSAYWDRRDAARNNPEIKQGLPPVFKNALDLFQFYPGEVVYLAGMPGMGKTQILVEQARFTATQLKTHVLFFTREMTEDEIISRFVAIETGIAVARLKEPGQLSDEENGRVVEAMGRISQWKINLVHFDELTPQKLSRYIQKFQREYAVGLVIVDGLWLMDADPLPDTKVERRTRAEQINDMTKDLASIAKNTHVRLFISHQLSRESIKRRNHRPILADLSDSSGVEKNANIILALYRDDYPSFQIKDPKRGEAELWALKNRDSGKMGKALLRWVNKRYVDQEFGRMPEKPA